MQEELEDLLERVIKAFKEVEGPPRITLSVARGLDDHQYDELEKLAKEQRHHTHWKYVTDDEMKHYHDCWGFMDAQAFQFYLPAFVAMHLNSLIDSGDNRLLDLDSFPLHRRTVGPEKLTALNQQQKEVITDYLYLIEQSIPDELSQKLFRPTRQAWEKNIKT
ncbi:DUF6714 family protein [Rubellicoccus peritrichatus]|uniref:DUF6714 family protein n=1 Tax=Rubellicoccus peritrichatus TaxID=3080537 RepID=A0AAQ3QTP0_9BACT|nr:DUF6714 family protein [Puniceicoccus sp. CR14]WOO41536.1 DUF6714 family protein [Puniceicoccus sp. CR14]